MVHLLQKTVWRLLRKLNIELPYGPVIPLLGIFPKGLKTGTQTNICTHMFIAALCTTAMETTQMSINE